MGLEDMAVVEVAIVDKEAVPQQEDVQTTPLCVQSMVTVNVLPMCEVGLHVALV